MPTSMGSPAPQDHSRAIDPLKLKLKARLRAETDPNICGQAQKAIAYDLRTSDAQLTRYLGDQYPDDLPAHKVPHLTRSTGPGYMEELARLCGGVYHHGEHAPHLHQDVVVVIGLLANQSGKVVQQLLQDLNKHLNQKEDLPGLRKLRTLVETLIADVEGGGE